MSKGTTQLLPVICGATWSSLQFFALACPPFTTWQEGGLISGMVRCLGPLPEEWKGCYIHSNELDHWYDQHTKPDPKVTIEA